MRTALMLAFNEHVQCDVQNQAHTQGFEKGGYIGRKNSHGIFILILSYSSVMTVCKIKQLHREHEAR